MTSIACHLRLSAGFTAPPYHLRAPCDQGGGCCDGYRFRWHVAPFPVARRRRLREARVNAAIDDALRRGIAPEPEDGERPAS